VSWDTKVLIVDDHEMVRAGLRTIIENTGRMKVVGEAADGEEAIRLAQRLEPDVILMDIDMPRLDGIEATRRMSAMELGGGVLILTRHDHEEYLEPIMSAGAMGFIRKSRGPDDLVRAVDLIAAGRTTMPRVASQLYMRRRREFDAQPESPLAALNDQEREILRLTARGYTASQIAGKMSLARKTIENYRARLKEKLGLRDRSDWVDLALKSGLLLDE
jgi:two-component system response regulator NreC